MVIKNMSSCIYNEAKILKNYDRYALIKLCNIIDAYGYPSSIICSNNFFNKMLNDPNNNANIYYYDNNNRLKFRNHNINIILNDKQEIAFIIPNI